MRLWNGFTAALVPLALIIPITAAAQPTADDYPNKTVRIVVPFSAGGSTDIVARLLAEKLGNELKQQFIVENRGGAGGNLGAAAVARSPADGYTLLMGTTGVLAVNNAIYKDAGFDAAKDFDPVSYTSLITNVLVTAPSNPFKTTADLVNHAKQKPGELTFASSGFGSSTHLSGELFKSLGQVNLSHVPYKGSSQALSDVLAGRVTVIFDNAPSSLPFINSGRLRPLAVTGSRRLPNLPDVPTVQEAGLQGYESLSWSGIVAPAGTPKPIVAKLNSAIDRILKSEDVKQKLAGLGTETVGGPPEVFARHIRGEREKWSKLVKEANITVN
jgi:tripartite-type tricarboxylate transporter receptor subunit TctC